VRSGILGAAAGHVGAGSLCATAMECVAIARRHSRRALSTRDSRHRRDPAAADDPRGAALPPQLSLRGVPCKELWPNASVDARLPSQPMLDETGTPLRNAKGKVVMIPASKWLEQNQSVEQMTWAPGLPELIEGRLVVDGGWIDQPKATCLNIYRPPRITLGDANQVGMWVDHVRKIYPSDADHIIAWLAQRVQYPETKINHALVLSGMQGIGKDTLLQPVKYTVAAWNFHEVSPKQMLGRFNGFVKSVILRVNEARDLGDIDRFAFYDSTKVYAASPPDVLRVD